ncbi:MAG: DUF2281 domain-containing protein [Cellulosilyticaceae bacterium]
MTAIQKLLHELVEELPDKEAAEVVDFIEYLKLKKEKELYRELQQASESSLEFWDNDIDDEVWNNV